MKAHCCPVCLGRGLVPRGFYDTDIQARDGTYGQEPCRTCDKGVIWEMEYRDEVKDAK